jgi:hypothetical protein
MPMDAISVEALTTLTTTITSLLPAVADPALQPAVLVTPTHIMPTGIGGFVGQNDTPPGEITGRRLKATALITVRANTIDDLSASVTNVTGALLALDRASLLQRGLLRLDLDSIGQVVSNQKNNKVVERELSFKVFYEFLKQPQEAEAIIQQIPINLSAG